MDRGVRKLYPSPWPAVRAAGLLLFAPTGRCLLLLRTDDGYWSVPGGHVEPGESAVRAALRELHEETAYAGPVRVDPRGPALQPNGYALFVADVPGEFCPRLDAEHRAAAWARPDAAPAPLYPGLGALLRAT